MEDGGYGRAVPLGPVLHRRAALLGAAATVLVAGCDHGDDIGEAPSTGTPSTGPASSSASAAAEQTPDELLVDQVTAQLVTALSLATASAKAPGLRRAVAPLVKAHRRHVRVLEGELPPTAPPGPPPDAATSLRALRRGEQQLQAALVDAATRAQSGALAKLLASMSASVGQHLAVLPREVGG